MLDCHQKSHESGMWEEDSHHQRQGAIGGKGSHLVAAGVPGTAAAHALAVRHVDGAGLQAVLAAGQAPGSQAAIGAGSCHKGPSPRHLARAEDVACLPPLWH